MSTSRNVRSRIAEGFIWFSLAIGIVPLVLVMWEMLYKGLPAITPSFFTSLPPLLVRPLLRHFVNDVTVSGEYAKHHVPCCCHALLLDLSWIFFTSSCRVYTVSMAFQQRSQL